MSNIKLQKALAYRVKGISVIPIQPNGKAPIIKTWTEYQKHKPTEQMIKTWWGDNHHANIGLICGKVSNLLVVDFDLYKDENAKKAYSEFFDRFGYKKHLVAETPSGGLHYYFKYREGFSNIRGGEGIDLKTDGGYVLAYPSKIDNKVYKFVTKNELPEMSDDIFDYLKDKLSIHTKYNENVSSVTVGDTQLLQQGARNNALFTLAWHLQKGEMHAAEIQYYLTLIGKYGCNPSIPNKELAAILNSAIKRSDGFARNVSQEISKWVLDTPGFFSVNDCYRELNAISQKEKGAIRAALARLHKEGIIEKYGSRRGIWSTKNDAIEEVNWQKEEVKYVNLWLPFGLADNLVSIMPKNIIIIAGVPNVGKTALMLNILKNNMLKNNWVNRTYYFSSEMGGMELKSRLMLFDNYKTIPWKFKMYERSHEFHKVIDPNGLNIIDFLEVGGDDTPFTEVGHRLTKIHNNLKNGIAVVALQKHPEKGEGQGGWLSLEKPRLYLTVDPAPDYSYSIITIKKAKNWKDIKYNPNGKKIGFKIVGGCKLFPMGDWDIDIKERY